MGQWIALVAMLLAAATSEAGPIADSFSAGVLGLPWGSTADQIESKLPGGKWKSLPGGVRYYTVRDGRTVLGIERRPKNEITLSLSSSGGLISVGVFFPGTTDAYGGLLLRAQEQFGHDAKSSESVLEQVPTATFTHMWPDDEGIRVTLSNAVAGFSSTVVLTIENVATRATKSTGLE